MSIPTFKATKGLDVMIGLALGGVAAILAAELDWIDPDTYSRKPIPRTDDGGTGMRTWALTGQRTQAGPNSFTMIVTPATVSGPATANATLLVQQNGKDLSGTDDAGNPVKSPLSIPVSTTTASPIQFNINFA